jgi:hypothetical protein
VLLKTPDGVADEGMQQTIKGSIEKLRIATGLCHEEVCSWVYVTVTWQSSNEVTMVTVTTTHERRPAHSG